MLKKENLGAALSDASERLRTGDNSESLLFNLRENGADKIDSINIIKSAIGLSMSEAKSLVDGSETWSDRYAHDEAFHQLARELLSKLSNEIAEPKIIVEEPRSDPNRGN